MSELDTGAYIPIPEGILVDPKDVIVISGVPCVPVRAYKSPSAPIESSSGSSEISVARPSGSVYTRSRNGSWKLNVPPTGPKA